MRKWRLTSALALVVVFALSLGLVASKLSNSQEMPDPLDAYKEAPNSNQKDIFWAKEIVKGDRELVLWFRHGEREKWIGTVTVFDYFDVNYPQKTLPKSWRPSVCLTAKGVAESQLMGVTFRELKVPISAIVTSPSCRAKETAKEAFGHYDKAWLEILHPTAIPLQQQRRFALRLKDKINETLDDVNYMKGSLVVTGHGNTLPFYEKILFVESNVETWDISELGFIVLERTKEGLVAQHSFVEFYQFANKLLRYKE